MATYRIKGPDGASYRIQAPDDATQDQVMSMAHQHIASQAAPAQPVDTSSPAFKAKLAQQQAADAAEYDPLKDTNWGQRALLNFGAGVDTTVQGVKQLAAKAGWGTAPSDQDIEEKRRRDDLLAESTGGGKLLQIGGEVVPGMAAGALGAAALPEVAGVAGMGALTRTLAALGPTARMMLGGGLGGASSAALSPVTSEESRPMNMAVAGTLGMAVPGGGALLTKAGKEGLKIFTKSGTARRAAEFIREKLPAGYNPNLANVADETAINVRNPSGYGQRTFNAPTSAAQATGDAELAQLEAWSRSRPSTTPSWQQFDTGRNAELYRATQEMAPSDLRMSRLRAVREGRTGPTREAALQQAAQQGNFAEPVLAHVQQLVEGPSGANPAVDTIGNYIQRTLGPDARGAVTPERLYEVRKVLTDKLGKTGIGDDLGSAAKTARRETTGIVAAIDQALDNATGGQWSPYLQEYTKRSLPITSGTALRDVAEAMSEKPLLGTSPQVTFAGYGKVLDKASQGRYGSKLVPEHEQGAQVLRQTLGAGEAAGRTRKLSATMGGGSITNTDQQLAALGSRLLDMATGTGVGTMLSKGAERVGRFNQEAVEAEVARVLQQPTQLAAALRGLSPSHRMQVIEEAMRNAAATGGAGAGAAVALP